MTSHADAEESQATPPAAPKKAIHRTDAEVEALRETCRLKLTSGGGNVVLFCGAGVTISEYGADASWQALLLDGLQYAQNNIESPDPERVRTLQNGLTTPSTDPDHWPRMGDELTQILTAHPHQFGLWLRDRVEDKFVSCSGPLLKALADCAKLPRVRLATTNYDFLLQRATGWNASTPAPAFSWRDQREATEWHRGNLRKVYHVHGHAQDPESIVLGTLSYQTLNGDGWAQRLRTCMAMDDTVIFVGCGATLQDPAFRAIFEGDFREVQTVNRSRRWFQLVSHHERTGHNLLTALPYGTGHADLPKFLDQHLRPWLASQTSTRLPTSISTDPTATRPLLDAAQHLAATRQAVRQLLPQALFQDISGLQFAPDGLPQTLSQALAPTAEPLQLGDVTENCLEVLLTFAESLVPQLTTSGPILETLGAARLRDIRSALIDAMQKIILLCLDRPELHKEAIQSAYDPSDPPLMNMASELSVSATLRPRWSNHLKLETATPNQPALRDTHQIAIFGVEMGVGKERELQVLKAAHRYSRTGEPGFPDKPTLDQIQALQDRLKFLKKRGKEVIAIMSQQNDAESATFIHWLTQETHIGLVTLSGQEGDFLVRETFWKHYVFDLFEVLSPLDTPPKP